MEKQLSDSNSLNAAPEFVHGLRHSFWVIKNKVCLFFKSRPHVPKWKIICGLCSLVIVEGGI